MVEATSESLTIGSAPGNDLVTTDTTVSRYHVELRRQSDRILVEDHRSTNGTCTGGVTIQRFLRAGLIRDMVITTVPVLLGAGRRLFGPLAADVALDLTDSRAYANGLVQSRYKVRHGAGEAAAAGGAPGRGPGHG